MISTASGGNSFEDFVEALERAVGDQVRADDDVAKRLWSSLTNVEWLRGDGGVAYSFRAAGSVIANIRGSGSYLDWYCNSPYAEVDPAIAEALAAEGWTPRLIE